MKTLVHLLTAIVRRWPLAVVLSVLALTVGFGALLPQAEQAQGNESFAPDTPEFHALETIETYFSANSEESVQVLFKAGGGDIFTADGLRTFLGASAAIKQSEAGQLLVGRPGGDIVGIFTPLLQGLGQQADQQQVSVDVLVDAMDDRAVKQAFLDAFAEIPPDQAEIFRALVGADADLSVPRASSGLAVVFVNVAGLDDPTGFELQEIEVDLARSATAAAVGDVEVMPFSLQLLFSEMDEFESEVGRIFLLAFVIILAILSFVYWVRPKGDSGRLRSIRRTATDVGVTLLVIVMAIIWMNGIGVLLGPKYIGLIGKMNQMAQILPILLIGLGVDYAIHLNSRYREELGAGADVMHAAGRATATVGVALVLATLTTSVGFLTNFTNPLGALSDFGVLAAVGITSAFALMLTFLPALRILLDRRAERGDRLPIEAFEETGDRLFPRVIGRSAVIATHFPWVAIVLALALGGAGAWGLTQLETEFAFEDFIPEGNEYLSAFTTLQDEFGGGFGEQTQVLLEGDIATPRVHNAMVFALGNMTDTPNVLTIGDQAVAESPVSVIAQLVTLPDQGGSEATFNPGFAEFAFDAGLQQDLTVAQGTDVDALYRRARDVAPGPMNRVLAEENGGFAIIDINVATQAGDDGALALVEDLADDFAVVTDLDGVEYVATNNNIIGRKVVQALNSSQITSLFLTIGAAMLLLMFTFWVEARRPMLGVLTIAPVGLVVLWVFGVMAARGISFNPLTAMITTIAIGIGVPYTIHVTHRYEEDRLRCDTPEEAIRSTATHTGGALAGSAFTTAAGFGVLVTSTLKPFQQLGEVLFWSIGFAFIASVLVLPSLLVVWTRWHRRRGHAAVDEKLVHVIDLDEF